MSMESHWTVAELPSSPAAIVDMVYRYLTLLLASENQLATIHRMDFPPPSSVLCFCNFLRHAQGGHSGNIGLIVVHTGKPPTPYHPSN
nr:hypothetical protein CFP56_62000 [Quercus suber]